MPSGAKPTTYLTPYTVAIYFNQHKLGFVPRNANKEIDKLLEQGYTQIFEVRINPIDAAEHPENQVHVIVYLKATPQNQAP